MNRDKNHDLCSIVQTLWWVIRQKVGSWQPYWILATILIFYLTDWNSNQNCFIYPYPQISTESETFAKSWNENIKIHMHGPPLSFSWLPGRNSACNLRNKTLKWLIDDTSCDNLDQNSKRQTRYLLCYHKKIITLHVTRDVIQRVTLSMQSCYRSCQPST